MQLLAFWITSFQIFLHRALDAVILSANALDKITTHHRRYLLDGRHLLHASPICVSRNVGGHSK